MGLFIIIVFVLFVLNAALNVWAMHRSGGWSGFNEFRTYYFYPYWLELIVEESAPGSPKRIAAMVPLAILFLFFIFIYGLKIFGWLGLLDTPNP